MFGIDKQIYFPGGLNMWNRAVKIRLGLVMENIKCHIKIEKYVSPIVC